MFQRLMGGNFRGGQVITGCLRPSVDKAEVGDCIPGEGDRHTGVVVFDQVGQCYKCVDHGNYPDQGIGHVTS